jgi:hypothetical protein
LAATTIAALLSVIGYAAIGVSATDRDDNCIVLVDTHACEAVARPENRNVPPVNADHADTSVIVSLVPPFVHDGSVPVKEIEPADAAAKVPATLVDDPALIDVVPALPGFAVCNWK